MRRVSVQRVDFRWDRGYIAQEEYVERRGRLEREMEALRPIDYDGLTEAGDLVEHFRVYWEQCEQFDNPAEARQQLSAKIVERVFVNDGQVLALVVHGNFGVVLGKNEPASAEIDDAVKSSLAMEGVSFPRSQSGDNGARSTACIQFVVFAPHHIVPGRFHHANSITEVAIHPI